MLVKLQFRRKDQGEIVQDIRFSGTGREWKYWCQATVTRYYKRSQRA
jgi:hypothetical protein